MWTSGAGVPPAVFPISTSRENAGETPAPRKPAASFSTLPKMGDQSRASNHQRYSDYASEKFSLGTNLLGQDEERNYRDPQKIHNAGHK